MTLVNTCWSKATLRKCGFFTWMVCTDVSVHTLSAHLYVYNDITRERERENKIRREWSGGYTDDSKKGENDDNVSNIIHSVYICIYISLYIYVFTSLRLEPRQR